MHEFRHKNMLQSFTLLLPTYSKGFFNPKKKQYIFAQSKNFLPTDPLPQVDKTSKAHPQRQIHPGRAMTLFGGAPKPPHGCLQWGVAGEADHNHKMFGVRSCCFELYCQDLYRFIISNVSYSPWTPSDVN